MTNRLPGKIPCSVHVLTLNCAHILRRCLESLTDFGEIVVCDGNSTDGTLDIAREFGATIIKQFDSDEPNLRLKDLAAARNRAVEAGKYDWSLYIDSDESLPERTAREIYDVTSMHPPEHYFYRIPNMILYEGREITYAVPYPGYQMRLFNRTSGVRYTRTPHSRLEVDEKKFSIGYLKNPWYVIVEEHTLGYGYKVNEGHVKIEIAANKNQTAWQFIRWTLWDKSVGLVKVFLKTVWLYARHGFKETLPPRVEFARLRYKWLLLKGLLIQRITGRTP